MPRRVSSPEFVGRAPEFAALLDALDRASGGRFAATFLAGDAGVGKSRLLHEFERVAVERGARILVGDCVTIADGELPYAPISSALRGLDQDVLEGLPGAGRDELARLLPELAGPASVAKAQPPAPGPSAQARLFELLLALLVRLGEEAPVVLAMEDIHWADRSTLDFLGYLAATARRERIHLVCTYRTDELHRGHPLRTFLARHERPPSGERVELRPFTVGELAAQLQGILGEQPARELVERLYERTEGNAFFTEELLAASDGGDELPASLREALMLRIEALPQRTGEVLRVAAAHGRLVTHRLLAAACELSGQELDGAVREAVAGHVLVRHEADAYAFRHALVHEALEGDLLPGEREKLHLALALALDRDPGLASRDGRVAADLCRHWLGAHRLPEALAAAVKAGGEAEQVYAFAEASRHLEHALELWDRVDDADERAGLDEVGLYVRAAEDAYLSGDWQGAIGLIGNTVDMVDPSSDPFRAALLRERLGRYHFLQAESALGFYREAVDMLPADEPRPELARALAGLGQILMLTGRPAESVERCEQAIAVARRVGARVEEAHALNTLGTAFGYQGDPTAGVEHLRESLRMCEELGDVDGVARAYTNLAERIEQDGRLEEAAEVALAGARRAGELGMRDYPLFLEGEAANRLAKLGRLDEAERLTDDALELRPSMAKLIKCEARARVAVQRTRIEEAERLLVASDEATANAPSMWGEPLATGWVELELLRGRPEEARRLGERALELVADQEYVSYTGRLYALGARAEAVLAERARAGGDEAGEALAIANAEALVERIQRLLLPERWLVCPPPAATARCELCALEARRAAGTAAAADWAALAARWSELSMPLDAAYARLREAECLTLDSERAGAEAALAAGYEIADSCGSTWLRGELESLARRARLPVRAGAGADGAPARDALEQLGLTEREVTVLELVTRGLTNRQIGEQLFISQKTASLHVSRILTKLGVRSRVEAATAAQRLGIVE